MNEHMGKSDLYLVDALCLDFKKTFDNILYKVPLNKLNHHEL